MRSIFTPNFEACALLTYVRSSPHWKLLYQYSRGAPLSTPKKFSGAVESPWAPKEIVPKCSPVTKAPPFGKFATRGSVITSSKRWKVRLKAKRNEFSRVGRNVLFT